MGNIKLPFIDSDVLYRDLTVREKTITICVNCYPISIMINSIMVMYYYLISNITTRLISELNSNSL